MPASASLTTDTGGTADDTGPHYKTCGRYSVWLHRPRIRLLLALSQDALQTVTYRKIASRERRPGERTRGCSQMGVEGQKSTN
jgi:hypothetical protein